MGRFLDPFILGPTLVLSVLGLVILASISPNLLTTQISFLLVGFIGFVAMAILDIRSLAPLSKLIYITSLLFLFLPYLVGELTRGTFRWITLGPVNIQPSELVKPLLALAFARFFSTRTFNKPIEYLWAALLVLLPVVIIFFQPDLGSALVVAFGWTVALVANGLPLKIIAASAAVGAAAVPLLLKVLKPYQQNRLISFFNPGQDPLGAGYNVIQAVVAVGSGQLLGKGLGQGTQSHLRFLPENHTDFVFASLAEEMGFLGILIVICSYVVILWRLISVSPRSSTEYERLTLVCLAGMFFFQIFVNIGMNMGLLPVTGVPLPLVSYGGSSLVSTLLSLGIVSGIVARARREEDLSIR